METILLPDLGDFQDVEIIEMLVKEGDMVEIDEPLLTLETEKAAMDLLLETPVLQRVPVVTRSTNRNSAVWKTTGESVSSLVGLPVIAMADERA